MPERTYDLTLTGLAYGGEALGRLSIDGGDERVVFVPFGLPGERVRLRLVEERRGFARGQLLEVLEPSPERITPRCKHFGDCGGCHYQHIPYESQLRLKADIVRDQLRRIGRIADPPVGSTVPSPQPYYYRNQVQFHLTPDGRLAYVAAPIALPGSEAHGPQIPVTECHLPEPAINALWPQLQFEPGTGLERVTIRQGEGEDLMLVLESSSPDVPDLEVEAGISIAHIYEEHAVVIAGSEYITIPMLDRTFRVSPASFFQVNTPMAAAMVEHILASLSARRDGDLSDRSKISDPRSTILDVYCGAGLFSAFLAPLCERLIGIENSSSACEDFAANLDEFENVELYEDAAENVLPALDVRPDLILVDPPRAGLEPAVVDSIIRLAPPTLIYVSCDPSTLARDAARLIKGGYDLASVTPFDLFPQTYHIESISWFKKR